jgi:hypothetical protein
MSVCVVSEAGISELSALPAEASPDRLNFSVTCSPHQVVDDRGMPSFRFGSLTILLSLVPLAAVACVQDLADDDIADSSGAGDGDGDTVGDGDGGGGSNSSGGNVGASGDGDGEAGDGDGDGSIGGGAGAPADGGASGDGDGVENPLADPDSGPAAGNPAGTCSIPSAAGLEGVSIPKTVIGDGSRVSCTGQAVIDAVAQGGVITFDCGPDPITITLPAPAKVFNDADDEVILDGAGLVTLSGGGTNRILYMNTCDEAQHWTTSECQNQDHPRLTVQNLTFIEGDSRAEEEYDGGGAIWVRGGQFKVVNSRFFNNIAKEDGPDVGGGAIRVFDQYEGRPVYVVNSTFGGEAILGNTASNGGALSSIGVSWTVINSVFSHNHAVGNGGNPAESGSPGGGSGGAIYNDGNEMTLDVCGSVIEDNDVQAFGAAIFFISNNKTGDIVLTDTTIRRNCGGSWHQEPGISRHEETQVAATNSDLTECE